MSSQNGIVGDEFGTDLPVSKVDQQQLDMETKAAKFSKTTEYQKLKEHLESRIAFYQTYLPDGRGITEVPKPETWVIANSIIAEFKAILSFYETAKEVVEEHNARVQTP